MPFKSEAQRRLFFAKNRRGEISDATLKEWQDETRGKKLPKYVEKKARLIGMTYDPSNANIKALQSRYGAGWKNHLAARRGISPANIVEKKPQVSTTKTAAFDAGVVDGMEKVAGAGKVLARALDEIRVIPARAGRGAHRIGAAVSYPVKTVKSIAGSIRDIAKPYSDKDVQRMKGFMTPEELKKYISDGRNWEIRDAGRRAADAGADFAALAGTVGGAKYLHGKWKKRKKTAADGGGDRSYDITHSSWPEELKKLKKNKGAKSAWSDKLQKAADSSTS